ncbi:MAG: SLBB domain-containing protein, partial [Nitrospinota bacterium]
GIRLWLNDGSGRWTEDTRFLPKFGVFYGLSVRDIDGDGRLDVTVASRQDGVKVWLRGTDGPFAGAGMPGGLAQAAAAARKMHLLRRQKGGGKPSPARSAAPPGKDLLYPPGGSSSGRTGGKNETAAVTAARPSPRPVASGPPVARAGKSAPRGEAAVPVPVSSRPPTRSSTTLAVPAAPAAPAAEGRVAQGGGSGRRRAGAGGKTASSGRSRADWRPPGRPKPYVIGIGDGLEIAVWRGLRADLHKVLVDERGKIGFAFLENVQAAGLTVSQLDVSLSRLLKRFIKRPRLDIRVSKFRSQSYVMLGEIGKPGRFPIMGPIRVFDAVLAAGGSRRGADLKSVQVLRRGRSISVNLEDIFEGDQRTNILLEDGDQVLIPKLSVQRGAIRVVGQVPRQGSFPIRAGLRVLDAVLLAGCCRRVSSGDPLPDIRRARVIRQGKIIPVNLEEIMLRGDAKENILLQDGDQVIVPGEARGSLTVVGEIARPGRYPIEGRTQILDVILLAGGHRSTADLTQVKVYRKGRPISVNLAQVLFQGDARQNIEIRDGDQVVVPILPAEQRRRVKSARRVYALGEVRNPGVYTFAPSVRNLSLLDVLTRAGGFTKFAVGSSTKVIRGDIERPVLLSADVDRLLEKGDITQNVPLRDQDIVFVPRSFIGDANDWMDKIRPFLTFFLFPATYRDSYATSTDALRVDIGGKRAEGAAGALQTIELGK